jgi:histidyl-tRNA synthetase
MRRSMKAQMKEANRHNVKYAVMLGETELADGTVVVKDLQSTEQQTIRQTELETLLLAS